MSDILIKCIDQVLIVENNPDIASGDVNVDRVTFDLCPKWDSYTNVAVFYNDPENVYQVMLDENNTAIIPSEVMRDQTILNIGVMGVKEGEVRTSKVIRYRIFKGAIDGSTWIENPTPSIFEQLIGKFNSVLIELDKIKELTVEEVDEICSGTEKEESHNKYLIGSGLKTLWTNITEKFKAVFVTYDNSVSKLNATTVQGGIDETVSKIENMNTSLDNKIENVNTSLDTKINTLQNDVNSISVNRLGGCYLKYENGSYYIGHDSEENEV